MNSPDFAEHLQSKRKIAVCLILLFGSSLSVIFINKQVFRIFPYTIFVTLCHFSLVSVSFNLLIEFNKRHKTTRDPELLLSKIFDGFIPDYPSVTTRQFLFGIAPIGVCTSFDVGFANAAYNKIPLNIMTVTKTSNLVFTYLICLVTGLEKFEWKTFSICLAIVAGIVVTLLFKDEESRPRDTVFWTGVILCLLGSLCSSCRWAFVQLQSQKMGLEPFALASLTEAVAAITLVPICLLTDFQAIFNELVNVIEVGHVDFLISFCWFFVSLGPTVFCCVCLVLLEYTVVKLTSSVTASVIGISKEIGTITMGLVIFHEHMSFIQILGVATSIIGIMLYSVVRTKKYDARVLIPHDVESSR